MQEHSHGCSRRRFLKLAGTASLSAPLWTFGAAEPGPSNPVALSASKVAITPCRTYALEEISSAFQRGFNLLGGLSGLVRNKTVTVKVNLTGTDFGDFLGRPVGETYMTHPATARVLARQLFQAGARRVRFVESTNSRASLPTSLGYAGWDVKALSALGNVEFENTRNLGSSPRYATLKVPSGGLLFSSFDLNRVYEDTDVLVSLCKLKNHVTAGVTLSMKNLFGITPNSLYGSEAGREDAVAGRNPIHGDGWPGASSPPAGFELPGLKKKLSSLPPDAGLRVPRTVVDICGARPIDLAIIDGITAMEGGEGPWCQWGSPIHLTTPGLLIVGLNPVSTDAVGTAAMGYPDPRALRGTAPFFHCDNHLLLAEKAGLGIADLARIEILGQSLQQSICKYHLQSGR